MDECKTQSGLMLLYEIDPTLIEQASLPENLDRHDNNHNLGNEWQKVALN